MTYTYPLIRISIVTVQLGASMTVKYMNVDDIDIESEVSFYIFFNGLVIDITVDKDTKHIFNPMIANYINPKEDKKLFISDRYKILTVKNRPQVSANEDIIKLYNMFDSTSRYSISELEKYTMNIYPTDLKGVQPVTFAEEYGPEIEKDKNLAIVCNAAHRFIRGFLEGLGRPEITDEEAI